MLKGIDHSSSAMRVMTPSRHEPQLVPADGARDQAHPAWFLKDPALHVFVCTNRHWPTQNGFADHRPLPQYDSMPALQLRQRGGRTSVQT
jgi:hypothetical protein